MPYPPSWHSARGGPGPRASHLQYSRHSTACQCQVHLPGSSSMRRIAEYARAVLKRFYVISEQLPGSLPLCDMIILPRPAFKCARLVLCAASRKLLGRLPSLSFRRVYLLPFATVAAASYAAPRLALISKRTLCSGSLVVGGARAFCHCEPPVLGRRSNPHLPAEAPISVSLTAADSLSVGDCCRCKPAEGTVRPTQKPGFWLRNPVSLSTHIRAQRYGRLAMTCAALQRRRSGRRCGQSGV